MRKKVLFIGMLVTLLFAFSGCGTKNERVVTLIMSDVQEGDHPTAQACDKFAELVKKRTNGKVVIEVYHGSTLGTEAEQIAQATVGGIDFVRVSSPVAAYYDDIKAFQALYLYSSEDDMWKVLDGEIGNEFLKAQQLKDNGLEGLCWVSGGSRNFYNNVRPITSPEDLAGLTLRVNTDSMFAFWKAAAQRGSMYLIMIFITLLKPERLTVRKITGRPIFQRDIIKWRRILRLMSIQESRK